MDEKLQIQKLTFTLSSERSHGDEVPSVLIQVIPYGVHHTANGDFILDDESAREIIKDFDSKKNEMVIDYEHQTLSGKEAPAAGWIKKLINKGKDGVWAVVEWTERAMGYLKNKEYRYISPVFLKRLSDNKVIKLINAALTNQPAIDGMIPIVNKERQSNSYNSAIERQQQQFDSNYSSTATTALSHFRTVALNNRKEELIMKKLLSTLGLAEDATEDEAIAVVTALKSQLSEISNFKSGVLGIIGLSADADTSEVTGTIMALKQAQAQVSEVSNLKSQISDLKTQLTKRYAEDLVLTAMKEGKVTPAQRDWAMSYAEQDPEGFKVFIAKAPVAVHIGEIAGRDRESGHFIDETQIQVNKLLGISDETFKKHNIRSS